MAEFESVLSSIKSPAQFVIDKTLFSIPSYQRPYVWPDDAIKSLFDGIYGAYKENPNGSYYVGTILTAKSNNGTFELIDGQQRSTSLMLLALACKKKGIDTELTKLICTETICEINNKPKQKLRLVFNIRDQVEAYLGHMAGISDYDNKFPGEAEIDENPYLKRLAGGLATFENLLDQIIHDDNCRVCKNGIIKKKENNCEQQNFANYVYNNVHMVNNIIPRSTDLNKLFATMNNSGIQLEQADILKSLLFKNIKTNKATYNAIWQACENMDNYFERNIRQVFPNTQWNSLKPSDFSMFDDKLFKLKFDDTSNADKYLKNGNDSQEENAQKGLKISEIIQQADSNSKVGENKSDKNKIKPDVYCTSIISFPQLLLHAYRIYLNEKGADDFISRFHPEQLINTFKLFTQNEIDNEIDIKDFIKCLWKVRYAFDTWVVKWVEKVDEDEEQLILCNTNGPFLSNDKYYFNRKPLPHSKLSLLQMVRYFTADRSAQYWLTSFLGWLVKNSTANEEAVLVVLESIDNQLSLANIEQKKASFILLTRDLNINIKDDLKPEVKEAKDYLVKYLSKKNGVGFRHYWFQKLEYLLYKHQTKFIPSIDKDSIEKDKFNKYRIISRNSVEHVHPQHEKYEKQLKYGFLNSFGNLALLNVSQNSSYSNKDVATKRIAFQTKPTYDSLKLKHIFDSMDNESWDEEKIKHHKKEMITLMVCHYNNNGVLNSK